LAASSHRDSIVLEQAENGIIMRGRFGGSVVTMENAAGQARYYGDGFRVVLDPCNAAATATGAADGPVDLTWLHIMQQILKAITAPWAFNYVSAILAHTTTDWAVRLMPLDIAAALWIATLTPIRQHSFTILIPARNERLIEGNSLVTEARIAAAVEFDLTVCWLRLACSPSQDQARAALPWASVTETA
jgi:hypothetical protein